MSDNKNEEQLKKFVEAEEKSSPINTPIGAPLTETAGVPLPWQKQGVHDVQNEIGWEKLKLQDLPTQGLFYPDGTEISVRSATAGEIRHWSTLNEDDLSALDDMLNYVIERCCNIKFPNGQHSSWRDIKEVDRFYILLAIRERTFVKGENKLQVKVSETNRIDVTKDMVDYITFDDRLMRYYSPEERCIYLSFKNGKKMKIYLPSVGVTNWLKQYINKKKQMQENIDEDFLNFAPLIISDWRGLNDLTYEKIVLDSHNWSTSEISMLTEIRKIFADTINPVIKYQDEQGGERVIPLNFQGGIKSILLISNPFGELA
jgi:hypothetical protein